MLHITKFYKPDCLGCDKFDKELELLQLNDKFSTPFVLHHVNIDDNPRFKDQYSIKKVPYLIFEDIPDFQDNYTPHPDNTLTTVIGSLEGYHRQVEIIHAIDFALARRLMVND